ncbi:MAG: GDSL-type esterase/lipase family protein [Planctomycetota bacterium]
MSRPWLKKASLVLVGLAVALVAGELALRVAGVPRPAIMPVSDSNRRGMFAEDPVRGYGYVPGFSGEVVRAGRTTAVSINERGFRDRPFDVPEGTRSVLTVGDSLTAGWGLEAEEAWPRQLEAHLAELGGPPTRVLNAGVTGYNMRQARLTAEGLFDELQPDLVVMGVYPLGFDRLGNPFVLLDGLPVRKSQVKFLHPQGDHYLQSVFKRPWLQQVEFFCNRYTVLGAVMMRVLGNLRRESTRAAPEALGSDDGLVRGVQPLLEEVGLLATATEQAGIRFVVLVISIQEGDGTYHPGQDVLSDSVEAYCAGRGIPCVPSLPVFRPRAHGEPVFKLPGDLHWSASAHDLAAAALAPVVREQLDR